MKAELLYKNKKAIIEVPENISKLDIEREKKAAEWLEKNRNKSLLEIDDTSDEEEVETDEIVDGFYYKEAQKKFKFNIDNVLIAGLIVNEEKKAEGIDFIYFFEVL